MSTVDRDWSWCTFSGTRTVFILASNFFSLARVVDRVVMSRVRVFVERDHHRCSCRLLTGLRTTGFVNSLFKKVCGGGDPGFFFFPLFLTPPAPRFFSFSPSRGSFDRVVDHL